MDDQLNVRDFNSPVKITWCPGCGNFTIINAIRQCLVEQNMRPQDLLMVFDIGCNGNMADKIHTYGFKGLHGRVLPTAAGAKLANKDLPVIAIGGDGGTLDEGMHHFIHTARSNYDITFIMHNNCNFGLTTGQETPTTPKGQPMSSTPWGAVAERINPTQLALLSGATFVACGWTGDTKHLTSLLKAGMAHKGFSYINVYQDCPTYNKFEDIEWLRERIFEDPNHDKSDWKKAFEAAAYHPDKRAIGILYQDETSEDFLERMPYRKGITSTLKDEVKLYDVSQLMDSFR